MAWNHKTNNAICLAVSLLLTLLSWGTSFHVAFGSLQRSPWNQNRRLLIHLYRRSKTKDEPAAWETKTLGDDGRLTSKEEELLRSIQYTVIAHQQVENADAKGFQMLSILTTHFQYTTSSEARHACRMGEILVARRNENESQPASLTERILPASSLNLPETLHEQDSANFTFFAATPLTSLQEKDLILQITRQPSKNLYPVDLTEYILCPPFDGCSNSLPRVVYDDAYVAIVDKPKGMLLSGVSRTNNLQAFLPFLLAPPANATSLPQVIFQRALGSNIGGLVFVAKSKSVLEKIQQYRNSHQISFGYAVLVEGDFGLEETSSRSLHDHSSTPFEMNVLKRNKSLVLIELKTHKPLSEHQLRDNIMRDFDAKILGGDDEEVFLFLKQLSFLHPTAQQRMEVSIETPSIFYERLSKATESQSQPVTSTASFAKHLKQCYAELGGKFTTNEGTACTGEPPIDPSKMIHPNQGDSEWIDDW